MPSFQTHTLSAGEHRHYTRMAKVIDYLVEHRAQQPELPHLSKLAAMSESHLQRTFKEWVGLSPKQFLQVLNKNFAQQRLKTLSVQETALRTGLSGGARLHDLMVSYEAVTPGEFRSGGANLQLRYGTLPCAFGFVFGVISNKGVVAMHFADTPEQAITYLAMQQKKWPRATFVQDQQACAQLLAPLVSRAPNPGESLRIYMQGSPFQVKVWEALMSLPYGEICSYQQLAHDVGKPLAVRAVASAVAQNQLAYLIPCHRVIRSSGELSHYRWNAARKGALLAWEYANAAPYADRRD